MKGETILPWDWVFVHGCEVMKTTPELAKYGGCFLVDPYKMYVNQENNTLVIDLGFDRSNPDETKGI
jgi:hypothetical protein